MSNECPMNCHGIVPEWSRWGNKIERSTVLKSHNQFDTQMNEGFKKAWHLVLEPFHKKAKGKICGTKNKVFY